MIYGYARVSADGQSVTAQVTQLTKAECAKVFRETASGAKTDRARAAHGNGARRLSGVREGAYSRPHQRRPRPRRDAWREALTQAEIDTAPEGRDSPPPGERRGRARDRPQLQRPQQHDFETQRSNDKLKG